MVRVYTTQISNLRTREVVTPIKIRTMRGQEITAFSSLNLEEKMEM